jgi:hypothetical protein
MCLAGELRNQIYNMLVDELPTTISPECLPKYPALASTTKQIRQEILSIPLSRTTVQLVSNSSLWSLDAFLLSINNGRAMIFKVQLPDFAQLASSRPRADELMDFLTSLPNLTELKIIIRLDHVQLPLVTNGHDEKDDEEQSAEDNAGDNDENDAEIKALAERVVQFAQDHALSRLGDLARLNKITVICEPGDTDIVDPRKLALFEGVMHWMASMFCFAHSSQAVSQIPVIWTEDMTAAAGFSFGIRR